MLGRTALLLPLLAVAALGVDAPDPVGSSGEAEGEATSESNAAVGHSGVTGIVLTSDYRVIDGRSVSDDGTVDLAWTTPAEVTGAVFQLEQSATGTFEDARLRYEGGDVASVLTGLPEGTFHFRVRALDATGAAGEWSEPLVLEVRFLGRRPLFLLVATGFVVAALTIGAIVTGFLRTRDLDA